MTRNISGGSDKAARKREFSGQIEGLPLVEWLNSKPKSGKQKQQRERVIKLLRLLGESIRRQKATGSNNLFDHLRAAHALERLIARLLALYHYSPEITLDLNGSLMSYPPWKLPATYDEQNAVLAIIRLAERGRFRAVHECDGCGKWLFSKKSDHATCSATCRARKRRQTMSDWDREEIRRKAREHYATVKFLPKRRHKK